MASFKFDSIHKPPNPAPRVGKIAGRLVPSVTDEPGDFEIIFRDGDVVVGRTIVTCDPLVPVNVESDHEVDTGGRIEQRNLTVQVMPGSTTIPLPVWLC